MAYNATRKNTRHQHVDYVRGLLKLSKSECINKNAQSGQGMSPLLRRKHRGMLAQPNPNQLIQGDGEVSQYQVSISQPGRLGQEEANLVVDFPRLDQLVYGVSTTQKIVASGGAAPIQGHS